MGRMTVEQALALLNTLTHECGGNRDIQALATLRAELDGLRKLSSRAYMAEQMRGLLPKLGTPESRDSYEYHQRFKSFNQDMDWIRERIEKWESSND